MTCCSATVDASTRSSGGRRHIASHEDSCIVVCYIKHYDIGGGGSFGVLGCQGPAPTPDFYAGRTCDADGFTGMLTMAVRFRYYAPTRVPLFMFDATDLTAQASNVW